MLGSLAVGLGGVSASGWFPALAADLASRPQRTRHCVLLWMSGGPTQTDTFDMKPNHANGGEFKEIETKAAGLRFSEHLPKLAAMADQLAVLRGLNTKEGDHGRGTYLMRTGHVPMGPVQYPGIGSTLANQLGSGEATLPNYVSIGPYRAFNQDAFRPGISRSATEPVDRGRVGYSGQPNSRIAARDFQNSKSRPSIAARRSANPECTSDWKCGRACRPTFWRPIEACRQDAQHGLCRRCRTHEQPRFQSL